MTHPPTLESETDGSVTIFVVPPLEGPFNRRYEDQPRTLASVSSLRMGSFEFQPEAELYDAEKEVVIRLELPGVGTEDVEIAATDRSIEIRGEKRSDAERRNGEVYASERRFGCFFRSFILPFAIDASRADASLDRGVLTLRVPKPSGPLAQPQRIEIRQQGPSSLHRVSSE